MSITVNKVLHNTSPTCPIAANVNSKSRVSANRVAASPSSEYAIRASFYLLELIIFAFYEYAVLEGLLLSV
jgi:hypothetical protein